MYRLAGLASFHVECQRLEDNKMSIREIRELLSAAGERRQRLGRQALDRQFDGPNSSLDVPQAPDDGPKALEES
jgi:hypothetical protein